MIYLKSDQVANTENQAAAYGHVVVSEQALAIGVTAVPTPFTDPDSDLFFVFENMATASIGTAAAGGGKQGDMLLFDSKAMRKVEEGQNVISVVEIPTTGISEGVDFRSTFRYLAKLH